MATTDPASVTAEYFAAWKAKDLDRYRAVLADGCTFDGPMGHETNADDCTRSFANLAGITTDLVVRKVFVDGGDVCTWFDLQTAPAELAPVVNWSHVEDGRITSILVTFDPRPLTNPGG